MFSLISLLITEAHLRSCTTEKWLVNPLPIAESIGIPVSGEIITVSMLQLMYFSTEYDAYEGLLRALSAMVDRPVLGKEAAEDAAIPIDTLYKVLHHGEDVGVHGDSHRFSLPPEQDSNLSMVWDRYDDMTGMLADIKANHSCCESRRDCSRCTRS